jgi:hypothetical protein
MQPIINFGPKFLHGLLVFLDFPPPHASLAFSGPTTAQPAHQTHCLPPIRPNSHRHCRPWMLRSTLRPSLSPARCTKCHPVAFSPSPHQPAPPLLPSVSISLLKSSALNSTKPPTFSLRPAACSNSKCRESECSKDSSHFRDDAN